MKNHIPYLGELGFPPPCAGESQARSFDFTIMFFQFLPSTRRGLIDHFMRSLLGYFKPLLCMEGRSKG